MQQEYTYGVARIRALESTLFTDDTISQLLQCESYEECMNFLRGKGWGNGNTEQPFEEMLMEEKKRTWNVLYEIVKDRKACEILTIPDEFHNLKAAIKQVCTQDKIENIFYTHCNLQPEFLKECIRQAQYTSLPEQMSEAAKEATEILLRTGNGQLCDVIIDRAALEAVREAGEQSENDFIRQYADIQLTIANIKTAVRCAATGKDRSFLEKCLVSCRGISITDLCQAADNGLEGVCSYLEASGYKEAVDALKESKSVFECWCDNRIMEEMKPQKYNAFTLGPIVAYVVAREMEFKTVKIILSGKLNHFDNDFIRERVRVMYA